VLTVQRMPISRILKKALRPGKIPFMGAVRLMNFEGQNY